MSPITLSKCDRHFYRLVYQKKLNIFFDKTAIASFYLLTKEKLKKAN